MFARWGTGDVAAHCINGMSELFTLLAANAEPGLGLVYDREDAAKENPAEAGQSRRWLRYCLRRREKLSPARPNASNARVAGSGVVCYSSTSQA